MTVILNAYKNGSKSANTLKKELGIKKLLKHNSKFRGKKGDIIINWGNSAPLSDKVIGKATILNSAYSVGIACNKLKTFNALKNKEYCPVYTESKREAEILLEDKNCIIFCRKLLCGHSGKGIVIARNKNELVDAKIYVVYVKRDNEYRIHVMNNKVISVQRKARKLAVPDDKVNWMVRNTAGGFIFARNGFVAPRTVLENSIDAVKTLKLFNGAVDIGYCRATGKATIYEINTACGLEGTTIKDYINGYNNFIK